MPALERFGWQTLFCTVQAADKALSKPHPGMVLQALSEAGIGAEDAITFGDTAFDMEMARAADVCGVAVSWEIIVPIVSAAREHRASLRI